MTRPPMLPNIAYLSTGSNLADKLANCQNGLSALGASPGVLLEAVSGFYLTAPMDYLDQPWFVNAAARIRTSLDPFGLLKLLKILERRLGRKHRGVRFGPRVLDFDILFFNDAVLASPRLAIPHPRLHLREFVLRPLCDLNPGLVHPVLGKTAACLLAELGSGGEGCRRLSPEDAVPFYNPLNRWEISA